MKKIIKTILIDSGLWIVPIAYGVLLFLMKNYAPYMLEERMYYGVALIASFIPMMYLNTANMGRPNVDEAMLGKKTAMYPKVNEMMLSEKPQGIVLGKDIKTRKYVGKRIEDDGHIFIIGGSGSGKSSCYVIPSLLMNKEASIFAIDIKGELSCKSTKYGSENVKIFNPTDRSQYGYDPFYALNEDSSEQEIYETMQVIAYSLIPMPANVKDPFWKTSSRNLLIGLLMYYYKQGTHNFVDLTDKILGCPVSKSVEEALEVAKKTSAEYRYLVQFKDMAEETLGGIVAEMNNHLVIFANDQDIRYAFKENCCKCSPLDLEEGYSLFAVISENKLTSYYDVLQLVINQTLGQLEMRPEDSKPVIFVIDEMARIVSAGKIDKLLDAIKTLRSRKVSLFLISQSTEGLMSAYTEAEVADLMSNCSYIVVLSASSRKTQQAVCSWCGKYKVRKTSWSSKGTERNTTVSYEEKDIVEPSDLMTLKNTGEAILISPYGYNRVKKVPYYEDKYLKPLAYEVISYNNNIKNK